MPRLNNPDLLRKVAPRHPRAGGPSLKAVTFAALLSFAPALMFGFVFERAASATVPNPAATMSVEAGRAQRITAQLTALAGELRAHFSDAGLGKQIAALAAERKSELLGLMRDHPDLVGGSLLSDSVLNTLGNVAPLAIEQKVSLGGGLMVVSGKGRSQYLLTRPNQSPLSVYSNGVMPSATQTNVSLSGYQLDNTVFIEAASNTTTAMTTSTTGPTTGMTGTINAAVIVTNFSDTSNPFSTPSIQGAFNGHPGSDVDSFFSEVSYNKTTLTPTFVGPYQLSMTQATGCASLSTLAQASISAANSSLTYGNFQRLIFVVNCPNLGDWATVGQPSVSTPQGSIQAGESWIASGSETMVYGYAHELGHNAGFGHADWAVCAPDAFDPPTNFGPNCTTPLYSDTFDTMGSAPYAWQETPHYDAYHKALAGWFSSANYPTVSAPGSYTYTLAPIESGSTGTVALNIPRGDSGTSFTVEYRQPIGFDSWLANCNDACNVTQGASIKLVGGLPSSADTHALDMTPGSQPWSQTADERDYYRDQALLPGKSFTDPEYGIQISAVSATSSGLTVQVTIPTQVCTHASPTVAASPVTTTVSPGQTATWSVTVTNNYSAGCPAAKFRFRAYGTHGSNPYTDRGLLTLGSGASTTISMSLPVATTLRYGTYSDNGYLAANALSDPGTTFSYSFTVAGPADSAPPTPPQQVTAVADGAHLVALHWLPGSDGVGVGGYQIYRNGSLLKTTSGTSFLDAAVSASTAYTYYVAAVNWGGFVSAYSNVASTATPPVTDTTPPGDANGVTATTVGDHEVSLNWRPATDNVGVAYYAIVHDNGAATYLPATATGFAYGDLWASVPTSFYVLAYDADGNSSDFWNAVNAGPQVTAAVSGTTAPTSPSAPLTTTVTPSQVAITWTPASGATGYVVYRDQVRVATVTSPSYTDQGVVPGAAETYTIVASDNSGNLSGSSPRLTVYMPAATASTTPPSATISSPGSGSTLSGIATIVAAISDPSGTASAQLVVDNKVQRSLSVAPYNFSLDSATLGNGPHSLTVAAIGNDGDVGSSATLSVSTSNPDTTSPTAPVYLSAVAGGSSQINLTWAASSDNVGVAGYNVLRNGAKIASPTSAAFTDNGLSPATAYSYQVRAVTPPATRHRFLPARRPQPSRPTCSRQQPRPPSPPRTAPPPRSPSAGPRRRTTSP